MDCPNITSTITLILNSDFEDLEFLIPLKLGDISNIEKTIIFVDSIEKSRDRAIYLRSLLLDNLKDKSDNIIRSFSSILWAKTNTNWLKDFRNDNTKIIIYIDIIGIDVDTLDIKCDL